MNYLFVELPRVDEVEDRHEDEGVEDEGVVPGVDLILIEHSHVVVLSLDREEAATADSASHHSVEPLASRVVGENGGVVGIDVLGDELLATEDESDHDYELEDGLAEDVLEHGGRNDVLVSGMGSAVQQFLSGLFSGQRQRGKGVHDQIHPKHLDRL